MEEIRAIEKIVFKTGTTTGFDAKRYNGLFSLADDPMKIQEKIRNECNRS